MHCRFINPFHIYKYGERYMHQLPVLCNPLRIYKFGKTTTASGVNSIQFWRAEHFVPSISAHSASTEKLEEETIIGRETGCISCKEEARIQVQSLFDCW